jgi:DNA-binding LacI/PurR family transcriptional regulator
MRAIATLEDVASRAGCSISTASRVLNGTGPVSEDMERRVRRAAAEIGYGASGSRTTSGKRGRPVVGVLVPSITNPVFSASVGGIQHRMQAAGHGVLIALSNYEPDEELAAVATLLAQRPIGLILTLCGTGDSEVLKKELPPTVLLNNLPMGRFSAAVTVDNFAAGHEITRFILSKGHSRILFVSGHFTSSDRALLRYKGYCRAMKENGIAPLDAVQIAFVDGYDNLDLIDAVEHFKPTAIIGSNDLMALGVIGALRRQGMSVPDDMSVAGFDGISIGRLIDRPLTTIEMPDASMGTAAASLLLDIAASAPARHLRLDHRLFAGETVRDIRQAGG